MASCGVRTEQLKPHASKAWLRHAAVIVTDPECRRTWRYDLPADIQDIADGWGAANRAQERTGRAAAAQ